MILITGSVIKYPKTASAPHNFANSRSARHAKAARGFRRRTDTGHQLLLARHMIRQRGKPPHQPGVRIERACGAEVVLDPGEGLLAHVERLLHRHPEEGPSYELLLVVRRHDTCPASPLPFLCPVRPEFGIREGNRVISLPASAGAAGEGSVALIAANPVKVGIFRDFRGFAVIEACRGMSPSSGESQERAR